MPDRDYSALYALDPDDFIVGRRELARDLRAAGDRTGAEEVAKLRKPPLTAWALDQVARQRPDVIGVVVEKGAELRAAMESAVAGDASRLRDAEQAERRAVDIAIAAASDVLVARSGNVTDATVRRMIATLRAAVLDPAVAADLTQGVLDRDVDTPGFGLEPSLAEPRTPRARDPQAGIEARRREERARRARLEADVQRLRRRADRLRASAEAAERRALEARAEADAAAAAAAAAARDLGVHGGAGAG